MTGAPLGGEASFRAVQRLFAAAPADLLAAPGAPLELTSPPQDPPRIAGCEQIERTTLRVLPVAGRPEPGFAAFLDGTQRSRVVHYVDGAPVVLAAVAAVVRVRLNRRMTTWRRPLLEERLYLPRPLVAPDVWERAGAGRWERVDTMRDADAADADQPIHPFELLQRAVRLVHRHREAVERRLAEDWCALERTPLFIDGGVSHSDVVAASPCAVGVVKSHHTIYGPPDAARLLAGVARGSRTTVFRIQSPHRASVASWYLRIREHAGRDPMWGLVRVEAALPEPDAHPEALTERADRISRWILAESAPLALPDGRWDRMVYGVRDCEEFLRALAV